MARASRSKRPKNREVENEMILPPKRPGEPPKAATNPSGSPEEPLEDERAGAARETLRGAAPWSGRDGAPD